MRDDQSIFDALQSLGKKKQEPNKWGEPESGTKVEVVNKKVGQDHKKKYLPLAIGITGIIMLVVSGFHVLAVFVGMLFGVYVGWMFFRRDNWMWKK